MQRAFINILSENVDEAANFYQQILGMSRHYDSNWFVILTHADLPNFEFGILERENEIVPHNIRKSPQGILPTFVVDDIETIFAKAQKMNVVIIEPPTDTPYGQRRMLVEDKDGTVIDISSPTTKIF